MLKEFLDCDHLVKDLKLDKGKCCVCCITNEYGEHLTDIEIQGKIYIVCCNHFKEWSERNLDMTKESCG